MTFQIPPELPKSQGFDYSSLDAETSVVVQQTTSRLKSLIRRSAQDLIEIGQNLIEVRQELGYGNYRKWLKAEFNWSHSAATKFIQVAQEFGCIKFMQVDIAASALYLLAAPSTPKAARQEALERAFQGERITHTLAKQIHFHHTIDVEAETVTNEKEPAAINQPPPDQEPLLQPELVNKPLPLTTEGEASAMPNTDLQPTPKQSQLSREREDSAQAQIAPVDQFEVGARVRILRHQHGEDDWSGKSAKIRQITPDGWLQVDVEGRKGVRFNLRPDWVEPMIKQRPEPPPQQPEPAMPQSWAGEPDPESSMPLHRAQTDHQTSSERKVRTTLTLFGESVEVEGTITHVQLKWQHGDCTGNAQLPVSEVEFLD